MLVEKNLIEFIDEVKSSNPTPGGGSVSALVGGIGGALTNMVGNLTIGNKVYDQVPENVKEKMEANFKEIENSVEKLVKIIDEDSTAFDGVMKAFKLPKNTDEEKKARSQAIQEGYKEALEVPLRCAKECLNLLELQEVFATHGNVNAITDVGVGTLLAYSGLEGALFNVTINLKSIKDETFRKEIEDTVNTLLTKGKATKEELLKVVYERLG
ncbi:cyclodeaminase/cyclohydrolase family protein [Tissierella sp. Yu-01]|uniref:cyclodeaminase/cyclohydrolase family protein n=1 Tax=Tissierella sp. Yu-01 TaxID=3035694 RepID=UPI00240D52DB|nr:cyclodeaminase/cyclohydrolase family protein [Tissierella sp. Yu-01]WFA08305.1 cyclodeaminase/cyclohydrolase family protein [Tissierella sp. Yu-01]